LTLVLLFVGKISSIAFSPECQTAGYLYTCANEAAATMAPNHMKTVNFFSNGIFLNYFLSNQSSKERPTTETSKLCVSLVHKICFG
jgi:hypothetical protein